MDRATAGLLGVVGMIGNHPLPGQMIGCPDCGSDPPHDDTCPIGLALDDISAMDRAWFERHPGADSYWRKALPADYGVGSLDGVRVLGKVHVRQVCEGVRFRRMPRLIIDTSKPLTVDQAHLVQLLGIGRAES